MQASFPCPKCGRYELRRSRSKNVVEKMIKFILPLKIYRCQSCRWRGWMHKHRGRNGPFYRVLLFYVAVILIGFIVANILRAMLF